MYEEGVSACLPTPTCHNQERLSRLGRRSVKGQPTVEAYHSQRYQEGRVDLTDPQNVSPVLLAER